MEEGYSRKRNAARRKRKTALARANRIAKRVDENKALPAESIAQKRLPKKTVQAIEEVPQSLKRHNRRSPRSCEWL